MIGKNEMNKDTYTLEDLLEQRMIGHGDGQRHAIDDVNAGLVDDLIEPRLRVLIEQREHNAQLAIDFEELLNAAREELATLKAEVQKAHDLVSRPGQSERHDFAGCLIDGIYSLQEGLTMAAKERDDALTENSRLQPYVQHRAQCRINRCRMCGHSSGDHESVQASSSRRHLFIADLCTCDLASVEKNS